MYTETSERGTSWGHRKCPLFRGVPYLEVIKFSSSVLCRELHPEGPFSEFTVCKGEMFFQFHTIMFTHTHITVHLHSYSLPPLTEAEKSSLEQTRADKSLFVQELLLSMLASSSSSSSDSGSDSEDGT